ncbi:MAG: hypothetical protein ACOYKE_04140 [Ferruginibacter sp.]
MSVLQDKKILLFIPAGRGNYGTGIAEALEARGATVYVYDERPSASTLVKVWIRLAKKTMGFYLTRYIKSIIQKHQHETIDYVLVVRGEGFTPSLVQRLKTAFPTAKYMLYLWDSLSNTDTRLLFPYFDELTSFDQADCIAYPVLKHRPQFFLNQYKALAQQEPNGVDVIFIGTVHSKRYGILKKILAQLEQFKLTSFFYLYFPSKILFLHKKITDADFKDAHLNDFEYKTIKANVVAEKSANAKASLDMQHPRQAGPTMRTIEMVGARRKLITTNATVKGYDFYDPQNILIIDPHQPIIDPQFLTTPYRDIPEEIYQRYSMDGWVDAMFGITPLGNYYNYQYNRD